LGKVERFTIGAAILGLLVDVIALGQFSGYFANGGAGTNKTEASLFHSIVVLILIFYSLIILGFALITHFGKKWKASGSMPSERAVVQGVNVASYVIVVPVFSLWCYLSSEAFSSGNIIPIGIIWWFGFCALPMLLLFLSKSLVVLIYPYLEEWLYPVIPFIGVNFEEE